MSAFVRRVFFLVGMCCGAFVLWFVPWVFVLPLGGLIYFPYEPSGQERFVRVTGPWASSLSGEVWTPFERIPAGCRSALIASEDTQFLHHNGIDWKSLSVQLEHVQKKGPNKARGASTITQQIVKNAFLSRSRSLTRKAREAVGALLLNALVSKEQQLTWYFNIVEWGPRIYGIHNAAKHYFHKNPRDLGAGECARLVALLPSPVRWSRYVLGTQQSSFWDKRISVIKKRVDVMRLTWADAPSVPSKGSVAQSSGQAGGRSSQGKAPPAGALAPVPPSPSPVPENTAVHGGLDEGLPDLPPPPFGDILELDDDFDASSSEKSTEKVREF